VVAVRIRNNNKYTAPLPLISRCSLAPFPPSHLPGRLDSFSVLPPRPRQRPRPPAARQGLLFLPRLPSPLLLFAPPPLSLPPLPLRLHRYPLLLPLPLIIDMAQPLFFRLPRHPLRLRRPPSFLLCRLSPRLLPLRTNGKPAPFNLGLLGPSHLPRSGVYRVYIGAYIGCLQVCKCSYIVYIHV
jgi:hypothetical protein